MSMLGDICRSIGAFCGARATHGGYDSKRSEGGVGGRKTFPTVGAAIDGGEGGTNTNDESPPKEKKGRQPSYYAGSE